MTAPYKIAVAAAATLLLVVLASLLKQGPQTAAGPDGPASTAPLAEGRQAPATDLPLGTRPAPSTPPALPFGDPTRAKAPAEPIDPARLQFTDTPPAAPAPVVTPAPAAAPPAAAASPTPAPADPKATFEVGRTAFDERGQPRPSLFDPQPVTPPTTGIALGPGDRITSPTATNTTGSTTGTAARPKTLTYTVKSGDNLSSIALDLYGSGTHWIQIAQANPLVDPDRLKTGQVIKLPGPAGTTPTIPPAITPDRAPAPDLGGGTQYTVKENDTLSGIAKQFYNAASKWQLIYQANRQAIGSDPGRMRPGTVLVIPPPDTGAR